jgi:ABC-type transport system involved in multi-copper enzyme maturation permease subunit
VAKIAAIARVTVQEAYRQKLAVNLLVFALALVAASLTISALTFGEQWRIIVDLGLSSMEVFGTLIAVFLGAGLVARDVERRTVYTVVAKPVSRAEYLLGRYLGLVATTTLNLLLMAIVFAAVLAAYTKGLRFLVDSPLLVVLASLAVRFAVVGAVAALFSSFSTITLAAIFTLSLVVAGHLSSDLVRYWAPRSEWAGAIGKAAYLLVPNLEALNLKEAMVYRDPVPASFAVTGIGYGLLYSAALVAFAAAVFARRDLR